MASNHVVRAYNEYNCSDFSSQEEAQAEYVVILAIPTILMVTTME